MKTLSGLRPMRRLLFPLALTMALSGCAVIEAQKIAGEGNRLVEKGQLEDASARYQASIAKKDNAEAHAGLAEVLLRQSKYGEAEREIRRAMELSPTEIGYNMTLAKIFLLQGNGRDAFEYARKVPNDYDPSGASPAGKLQAKQSRLLQARIVSTTGSPADAFRLVKEAEQRWLNDYDFRAAQAVVRALEGNYAEASELADQVLKNSPGNEEARLAQAMVLAGQGKTAESKQALGDVLKSDPTRVLAFMTIPRKLRQEGKNNEAVELLSMLEEVQPANHLIHQELAFLLLDLGKTQESIKQHELTLETYPSLKPYAAAKTPEELAKALKDTPPTEFDRTNLSGFYENLSVLYSQAGNTDKSIEYLERVVVVKPSLQTWQNLAGTYSRKGDKAGAMKSLERALETDPKNGDVLAALGSLSYELNQPDKAKDYFRRALEASGGSPELRLNLGVVLYNSKQYKDALEQFTELVKTNPNNVDAQFYLGLAQMQAGDKKSANTTFQKVVELKPDHADAYRELGNLAMERKDFKAAEKYYAQEDKYKGKTQKKK